MTAEHRRERLSWAKEKLSSKFDWTIVMISDEKKFNLDGPDGNQYYWHDRRLPPEFYSKRVAGGGSVMVWAAISSHGKSQIHFLEGRQSARSYIGTLEAALLPFSAAMRQQLGDRDPVFQQDGASIHTAQVVKTWLTTQNIPTFKWPSKSPDLSPIENVWGDLALSVYANGRQLETKGALQQQILKSWSEIDNCKLRHLMDGMEKRLVEVVARKGSHIGM
ncbi:hypothetical protein P43SY_006980 [Pythium insidiosum]|uniref:Tc1-like transposase DDE domain-containing protein n=1 Tax=Pythium insidiosum TaxID=114742 RepID=A0AAD5Q9B2_PYTIN|nr:hypothetical protein P43SY_006980 [Pythium insidiosum]